MKKLLSAVLTASMVMSLVGCAGGGKTSGGASTETTKAEAKTEAAADAKTEQAVTLSLLKERR